MLKEHDAETSEMPADSFDGTDDVRKNPMRTVYDWVETLCSALALMLVIFMFVFRYVVVDGTSMTNTLAEGDKLLISNVFYPEPKVGDIVVIEVGTVGNKVYDKPLIKRVIATEGQTVDINPETWEIIITEPDGTSYVLDETKYAATINHPDGSDMRTGSIEYPYTVGEGEVFVMGDNRNASDDSRFLGALDADNIVGRVILRVSPFADFGKVE